MKKPRYEPFLESLLRSSAPPWQGVRSRIVARWLDVSLQVLANWRVRDVGPASVKAPKGVGNKMMYRPDDVAVWLADGQIERWEVAIAWLGKRGLAPTSHTEQATQEVVTTLETMDLFS